MASDDLKKGLDLLRRLNALKTKDGLFVRDLHRWGPYSTWSFHQHDLFWSAIRPFCRGESPSNPLPRSRSKRAFALLIARTVSSLALRRAKRRGDRYLVYTPDKFDKASGGDFRFAPVYRHFREKGIPFTEVFHSLLGRVFLRDLVARRRPAVYLEAYEPELRTVTLPDLDLEGFSEEERAFIKRVLPYYLARSERSVRLIKALKESLVGAPFETLVAMDDVRYTNELIVACRENGIRTIGVQHGHFTKYLVGWMNYGLPKGSSVAFDTLLVWNDYWKRVLLDHSTQYNEGNVRIGGVLRPLPVRSRAPEPPSELGGLHLLVASEPLADKRKVGAFIDDLIGRGVKVTMAIRPDAEDDPLQGYGLGHPEKVSTVTGADASFLEGIHAAAGTYSTYLNELMHADIPVVLFDTGFEHGHRLREDGLVLSVRRGEYDGIIPYLREFVSKRGVVWPDAPSIEGTLDEIIR